MEFKESTQLEDDEDFGVPSSSVYVRNNREKDDELLLRALEATTEVRKAADKVEDKLHIEILERLNPLKRPAEEALGDNARNPNTGLRSANGSRAGTPLDDRFTPSRSNRDASSRLADLGYGAELNGTPNERLGNTNHVETAPPLSQSQHEGSSQSQHEGSSRKQQDRSSPNQPGAPGGTQNTSTNLGKTRDTAINLDGDEDMYDAVPTGQTDQAVPGGV
ncbi:hypothetical protein BG015_001285 [Linnemannia schmuckeri]|uniref:Uncharacterized protein n=1 Tax=Linnemannia schmuckeri TaxID=64567 RepID=A0A9P5RQ70_9FUNG|nr:hypothetical protein BG015_001285 [Linnemannia schmuckeri]